VVTESFDRLEPLAQTKGGEAAENRRERTGMILSVPPRKAARNMRNACFATRVFVAVAAWASPTRVKVITWLGLGHV